MYTRTMASDLASSVSGHPVLAILGPRQSGKTTLARCTFPDYEYLSLEDPDIRDRAESDPRGFLAARREHLILDEIQRVPQLTSYIQTVVDTNPNKVFILTGSNSRLLTDTVSQTLAGRIKLFYLPPLSVLEILPLHPHMKAEDFLFQGGYPRIYDRGLLPGPWLKDYFQTYVEKDIRLVTNVNDLEQFRKFVLLTAGRVGQLINYSSLSCELGISPPTLKHWTSMLKTTFICFSLRPYHKNFNKRVVKTSKLYFWDTGLLCYLLGIQTVEQLDNHPLRGNIFENFVVSEFFKKHNYRGDTIEGIYFFRDQKGHEVDLVQDMPSYLFPIEIKMTETSSRSLASNIHYLNDLQGHGNRRGKVIYLGPSIHWGNIHFIHALKEFGSTGDG